MRSFVFLLAVVLFMPAAQATDKLYASPPDQSIVKNEVGKYRHIVGLRPGREGGFRIEAETLSSRTVVHNYGHGGYGVTLSPGSAIEAISLVEDTFNDNTKVIVIGAGVNGLTIAYMLAQRNIEVEVLTKDTYPDIVSGVAAALWNPYDISASDEKSSQRLFKIQADSLDWFSGLVSEETWGIRPVELFVPTNSLLVSEVHFFLPFEQTPVKWHKTLPIEGFTIGGYQASTFFIDTSMYVPRLMAALKDMQVPITKKEVESLSEFVKSIDEDVIVFNASGLGAKWLAADDAVYPIRGDLCVFDEQKISADLKNDYVLMWGERPDYMFTRVSNEQHTGQFIFGGVYEAGDGSTVIKTKYCDRTLNSYLEFIKMASKPKG
jgi:glycine/D-amino acid oxidase-like deaminating enzyme